MLFSDSRRHFGLGKTILTENCGEPLERYNLISTFFKEEINVFIFDWLPSSA